MKLGLAIDQQIGHGRWRAFLRGQLGSLDYRAYGSRDRRELKLSLYTSGVILSCTHDKLNVWNIGLHVDSDYNPMENVSTI